MLNEPNTKSNKKWNIENVELLKDKIDDLKTELKREFEKIIQTTLIPKFDKKIEKIKADLEQIAFSNKDAEEFAGMNESIFTIDSSKGMFWVEKVDNKWYIRPYYLQSDDNLSIDCVSLRIKTQETLTERIEEIQSQFENYSGMLELLFNTDIKERKKFFHN